MSDKKKSRSMAPKTKPVSKAKKSAGSSKKPATKTRKAGAKSTAAVEKARKAKAEAVTAPAANRASKAGKAIAKTKKAAAKRKPRKVNAEDAAVIRIGEPVVDPIGDVSSSEGRTYLGDAEPTANAEMEAHHAETAGDALDATLEAAPELAAAAKAVSHVEEPVGGSHGTEAAAREDATEAPGEPRPPAKLERLQKILSQAGIASRRHAEEMIVAGRVMVNGQVVTTLGSKADPASDHIRVDGRLLQGAERHRYFVLNKPKGYVTTVSDPEGRSTVMEFFAGMRERLYPVGRLDYQSEGLLLMTNDGELANLLTKAGSGVEKTYLVKVAGQPSEEELERLRGGVAIAREGAGSERVRTAPARIRPVREGDNPWYEVVLIEGRNRELRKMFSAVGHFVEKIRRVGYGPLVLDVEPGKLRELMPEEVSALRLTAEGKLKPKRVKVDRMLPVEAGRAPEKRAEKRGAHEERPRWQRDDRPKQTGWQARKPEFRRRQDNEIRSGELRSREFSGGARRGFDKRRGEQFGARPERFGAKPGFDRPRSGRPFPEAKPGFKRPAIDSRPRFERPQSGPKARFDRPTFPGRPQGEQAKPRFERPPFRGRPQRGEEEQRFEDVERRAFRAPGERPSFQRFEAPNRRFEKAPARSFSARPEKTWTERPRTGAPGAEGGKKFAPKGRFGSRGGSKPGEFSKPGGFSKGRNFSKAGGKESGFRSKSGSGKGKGFRPPGKPGVGMKRG